MPITTKRNKRTATASKKKPKRTRSKANGIGEIDKVDEQDRKKLKEAGNKTKAKYSVVELEQKVEECMDTFNYELALKFCERIIFIDKGNTQAWETCGSCYTELEKLSKAGQCFQKAIALKPLEGASKYFSLAQISHGKDALQLYEKGIEVIETDNDNPNHTANDVCQASNSATESCNTDKNSTAKELCSVYCAIGELYMTDLCDEENAQQECEKALTKAIEVSGGGCSAAAEAEQSMANYLLTVGREEDAKHHLERSVSAWLPQLKAAHSEEEEGVEREWECPLSYEARVQAAEMLTELGDYGRACEVLELLLEEDDERAQVWYMLGLASKLAAAAATAHTTQPDSDSDLTRDALYYLNQANEVANKMGGWQDDDMAEHVQQLIAEMGDTEEPMDDDN